MVAAAAEDRPRKSPRRRGGRSSNEFSCSDNANSNNYRPKKAVDPTRIRSCKFPIIIIIISMAVAIIK